MRTTTPWLLVTALSCAVLIPGVARAEDREIELGGFIGTHIFNDDNELGVRDEDAATSIKTSFGFGFRLGFPVWRNLALEGELALMPSSAREGEACGEAGPECPSVLAFGWRASALWHFLGPESRVRPFALIGIGAMTSSSNDKEILDTDTDLVGHAGGGVKILVSERETGEWGVRLDGRALLLPSSGSEGVTTDFEAWAGVYVTFGGPRSAPEVAASAETGAGTNGAGES